MRHPPSAESETNPESGKSKLALLIFSTLLFISFIAWADRNGRVTYFLTVNGIGPWKKGQALIETYKKNLSAIPPEDRDTFLAMVSSDTGALSGIISKTSRRTGIPAPIIEVIAEKESGYERNVTPRFEAVWQKRARALGREELEIQMLSSSHGIMQVAGWWVHEFNRLERTNNSWLDLYYRPYNVELGAKIYKNCLSRQPANLKTSIKVWNAFRCYNGSGSEARKYADNAYRLLADKLVAELTLPENRG
ncbi:MAG: hypothetical protein PHC51_02025 [bacterium]|nr:hypothetical protein [bacterium]